MQEDNSLPYWHFITLEQPEENKEIANMDAADYRFLLEEQEHR